MMQKQQQSSIIWAYLLPLTVISISIILAYSPIATQHPELAIGITYDLALTAPLVYLFMIRNRTVSKLTVAPMFGLGILIATLILPSDQQTHVDYLKTYLLPIVEVIAISFIITKVSRTIRKAKVNHQTNIDFYTALKEQALSTFPKPIVARLFAAEVATIYYSLFVWKKPQIPQPTHFTNYQKNGITALFGALIFILLVETFAVHLILERWSTVAAWVLTILSIYSVFQFLGHTKAMKRRFSFIENNQLILRYGLFGDATIDIDNIEAIETINSNFQAKKEDKVERLSLLGELETANILITFKNEQLIEKAYGIKKQCKKLCIYIDQQDAFIQQLKK